LVSILQKALSIHRFPFFCASLIGGSTLLQLPIKALLIQTLRVSRTTIKPYHKHNASLVAKFTAALISAAAAFRNLNRGSSSTAPSVRQRRSMYAASHLELIQPGPFDEPPELDSREVSDDTLSARSLSRADLSGKTMDLTLFAVIRALDVAIALAWDRLPSKPSSKLTKVSRTALPLLFCFSAATIMHAWFYSPSRLPHSYNAWISSAAKLDHRLLLVLRQARYGSWVYGLDTGKSNLLGSMCHDYGLPEEMGDPAKTVPLPCELVHMGRGKSCEKHALVRFWRGWIFAAKIHAPVQLIVLLRRLKKNGRPGNRLAGLTKPIITKALVDIARGSAFLGSFISLFYYGVCLFRTRLGPKLFSYKTVTPQMWDSGLCVLGGCLLCGTSILVEHPRKRIEILMFVLPRAAATWFPRRYLPEHQWKECMAFSLSAAMVLTAAQEDPRQVRGMLGNLLHFVMKSD
jgi:hypothetical protein